MKINILALIILLISCDANTQNYIEVNIPTARLESEYVWRTIQDIKFFENNNYTISLPEGPLIEELLVKSKNNKLSKEDYKRLEVYIKDSIYNKSDYKKGYDKISGELVLIHQMINEINDLNLRWNYKEFNNYQINLTLYGPGGSYNPDNGSILIYTTPEGRFKNYENPINIIIHEIIHIGIEKSIINKYEIPHTLKERIVDTFVFLCFRQYLPDYRMQNMGDNRIDNYLKTKEDLMDLHEFVELIMKED